ncbi:DUF1127 domain-containing protein [Pseudomonas sp. CAU 1711]|uniref:DUF1127 domain-containing protein n=1 Tax=Pseudomonas sp. CAU 1711 TaxID=3140356 RepID=UPI0032607887
MREVGDLYVALQERRESGARQPLRELGRRWRLLHRRLSTRRSLLQLDASQLADIGLTAEQARAEATRPFWRLLR